MQEDHTEPRHAAEGVPGPGDNPRRATASGAHPNQAGAPRRRHRRTRIVLSILLVLLLVLAAVGYGVYRHLNGNLSSEDLPSDVGGSGQQLQGLPDGVAQNILVIGTDGRTSALDCKLGGACGDQKPDGQTNADVEMLVHISADHKTMAVVSIPRDTIVDQPACSGNGKSQQATSGRINRTLNYGTACTLRTVHKLTGLPITHFMMVDFSGVVSLSDAIGGVDVCVSDNVYDPYSHLKLAKGSHTLQGVAALQFLRTRHGFGDGSDLGRTVGQHLFLSSLQRKLESAGTLLNPSKVYSLADAATKALTVDTGLASVSTLAQVATTVGGIPASSTTFVTMPTSPDPTNPNTVVPASTAKALWAKLAADQPLATASPTPSASSTAQATSSSDTSSAGAGQSSATAAASSGAGSADTTSSATDSAGQPAAASNGEAQVSSETTGCAPVSQLDTVELNGVAMSPVEAYAKSPRIAVSAP